ncbi:hypothetical protein TRFO_14452 [Tritrichomonas foetus]|uniref:Uncharacterized protein n=1 Tax=Tritrichomonas foetus TaxID=1144522 RepID=A0A1J4KZI4_9EUKA|nr:hypothetical protein TRFO_14452 [Tritrichomonas foetus]|eukprot:OHT15100.1 hypothetical protein TRFO_14452 [Tritrichomonas foetus]
MSNNRIDVVNDRINNLRRIVQASDVEKEQIKNDISILKNGLEKVESFQQRAITAESKVAVLQQINSSLSQQINDLTSQNAQLINDLATFRNPEYLNTQNKSFKKQIISTQAQLSMNNQESYVHSNEIKQLQNIIVEMQNKHQQDLEMRDNLISKLRANANISHPSLNENSQITQISSSVIQEPDNLFDKQNAHNNQQQLIKYQNENLLLEKQLTHIKHEFAEYKKKSKKHNEKSKNNGKKLEKELDETRKKFHILKKKYVQNKEDFISLQTSYHSVVMKSESLNSELQKLKNRKSKNEELIKFSNEKQILHDKINKAEETIAQERDNAHQMKMRAEKAEAELTQLRYILKIMANNEKNMQKIDEDNENIIEQMGKLGFKLDRYHDYPNKLIPPPKRKPTTSPARRLPPKKHEQPKLQSFRRQFSSPYFE